MPWYLGITRIYARRVAFRSVRTPTCVSHPDYYATIGPFRTRRAAIWSELNPFGWQTVKEAETLAKIDQIKKRNV